jgi:alpha/beta superfamily hydrolase
MKTITMQILILLLVAFSITAQTVSVKIDLISNGNKLNAKFYPVESDTPSPTMILLHGFPGSDNNPLGLAEGLNQNGINILVFNYQGTFKSEGVFNYHNCANDLVVALDFLKQERNIKQFAIDTSRIIICGYSTGGGIALNSAVHNPEIKNIIAIAAGNNKSIYLKRMADDPAYRTMFEKRIADLFSPKGPIKGDSISLHNYFDEIIPDVNNDDLVLNADKLKNRKILFLTGWQDTLCPMEEYIIPVYRKLKNLGSKSVSIKAFDTDHYFSNSKDELTNAITEWINK